MGFLMKHGIGRTSGRRALCAAFSIWLGATCVCLGSGSNSALQKHFLKVFEGATDTASVEVKDQSTPVKLVEVHKAGVLVGYGAEVQVVSRSGPFFIMVAVSPEEKVLDVQIPRYPHQKGRGVRKKRFLKQFGGAAYGSPLVVGEQVDAVSGATSSSHAVTGGVRKALMLVHQQRETNS